MDGFIPPDKLQQIRDASDIVEIIGSYLPLKRSGANFSALCPFHKEKTPSFNVNPHKQIFHCFGCHKGGDVFTFVREYESISFMDCVRRLAERAHIALEIENRPGQQEARHVKDTLLHIHEQITQRWQASLTNDAGGQIARDYLQKRGLSEDAIKLFRLGYAPEAWDDTVNWAKGKGHEMAVMEQSGLVIRKEGTDRFYDRFRGRLIFPICDEQGRVIGFSGRILSGDEKTAKYVNSPETPIFTKGKVFFGLDKSKRALLDVHSAIICEGQLDLIACFMAGVKNVVAPQGTALTSEHARILKRYADEVVLCFDSDNAGQNAAIRSLDSLLQVGLAVRVVTMPSPHDPDSFIKENGGSAFQGLIDGAEGFFDFYLNRLCATNDIRTDKGRVAVVRAMGEAVSKANNRVLLDTYSQKTAIRLGVSADSVRAEFKKGGRVSLPTDDSESDEEVPEYTMPRPSVQEWWLLRLVLQNEEHVEWVWQHLDLDWLSHETVGQILASRFAAISEWRGLASWLGEVEDPFTRQLITEAVTEQREIPDPEILLKGAPGTLGVVQILRDKFIDRKLAELTRRLSDLAFTQNALIELSKQKAELRQMKQQPLQPLGDNYE
ncbi:MAG: DNA primase [Verrucomicrobia bacterium]|nr:DNA primase [Verrucomicrobiota bacterium]